MMIFGSRFLLTTVVSGIIFMVSSSMADKDLLLKGPIISPPQSEILLQNGKNFTISCKGNLPIHFTQQEIPEEVFSNFHIHQESVLSTDPEYKYEIRLQLSFVDRYAIGYFACSDDTFNVSVQLSNLTEEPKNTEHAAFIYIYVNGTDSLFAPMREFIIPRGLSKVVIECRPTTPDVQVNLTVMVSQSNKTPDILKNSTKIGFLVRNNSRATYQCRGRRRGFKDEWKRNIRQLKIPPVPTITGAFSKFLKGESFSLNCTVPFDSTSVVYLTWTYPKDVPNNSIEVISNEHTISSSDKLLYSLIIIKNATKQHAGDYKCTSKNNVDEKPMVFRKILTQPSLELKRYSNLPNRVNEGAVAKINCMVSAYPPIKFYFLKDNKSLVADETKYKIEQKPGLDDPVLRIKNVTVTDSGNYTLVISNGYPELEKSATFELLVYAKPVVTFGGKGDKTYMENTVTDLICDVTGFPLPVVTWTFSNGEEQELKSSDTILDEKRVYFVRSTLRVPVHAAGNITCKAENIRGNSFVTRRLLVYEIEGGFGIENRNETWYSEDDQVVLKCLASKYYFVNLTWFGSDHENLEAMTVYKESLYSHVAELILPNISLNQSGLNYTCIGYRLNSDVENEQLTLTIAARQNLMILEPSVDIEENVLPFQSLKLSCIADGVPPPIIQWYKDGDPEIFENKTSGIEMFTDIQNHTYVNSTIYIDRLKTEDMGKYMCIARSDDKEQKKIFTVALALPEPTTKSFPTYLIAIAVLILVLIFLVVYLTCKVKKDKQFRKELAAAGLLYFKKGVTGSLNPDLGIDEQAELLPYDEKFEFPPEKLVLGKQLGAGAFGVVYKAEARGIINAEETTLVAVKMVKKTADNMYIKALASELKIMIHMGKHMNIVNLLGACTKNVGKRELVVIVEYCKFGNIHNYLQRHREVFIDQLTDNKEKNLGKVNKGFTTSSGSTGVNSDYFGCNNTQDTDHTFVNTANTNRSGRKDNQNQQVECVKVSEGYVPEWRSNYESDYSFDGRNPRPLSSRDLLCWAFQIARGMEYLASRKVLHGDLAARNILLADDNVVKICDFGLAKSIYKNDEYQKKENSPLPVKWLAIECMTDRIFSTQSDVWSFGIVLWEMFSLAKTPYPNISPPCLLQWLSDGHRLEKPNYADDRLYDVMLRCWEQKPTLRPSFSQLQELLGTFLEDNVRDHYVDLNATYMACNIKNAGQQDYLEMVCAPDYKTLVTPSPHHYVNGTSNFFPVTPTTQIDEEGYLQMSPKSNQIIFSPREQGTTFDFDARKFNPRVSEASSGGSELTPMLTLNNLPTRSGSESDHEGNASPYLNMYPRIEEDPDEVFEKTQNAKNVQNTVTNPTYITFNTEPEKKPKDIINNYINIPNGLVN